MIPRTWLYVPGDRPDRIGKALAGPADAVILDLEDAVSAAAKDFARRTVLETLAGRSAFVRINAPGSPAGEADLRELVSAGGLAGVRVPKCENPDDVCRVADALGVPVYPILESALGVENAVLLASAHPLVAGISLGEADLMADLRVRGDDALVWPRSRVVVAARAAGLPSPVQSVWTAVRDLEGLRASTVAGRAAGFFGRSVIHPAQIPVVHEVCAPDPAETAWARELLERLSSSGESAWIDHNGQFVDAAIVARARWVLEIAASQQVEEGSGS
ncbi:HpcH/HpaI aldolase/citrate lyase family protein [Amycolatopsis thermophila]|uniref:Citrate lyase subunit beta/citryl-CoA lyase n=1 Tax=Amycolatopsis thermophila TaxID=206084 RepID=A0ABU0EPP2_9PSEU|nr:CoA ester lyase [Amycolatopsis thermophila]MDQ0377018.1 citrate lyase subunit beta/citryl-CoA lyase [Amycolatopsis thermophila]